MKADRAGEGYDFLGRQGVGKTLGEEGLGGLRCSDDHEFGGEPCSRGSRFCS